MKHVHRAAVVVGLASLAGVLVVLAACRETPPVTSPAPHVATSASLQALAKVPGYLQPAERPDSVALVPPAPQPGSAEYERDRAIYATLAKLQGTPRWHMAAVDADLGRGAPNAFACALGFTISESETPTLYQLMRRTIIDAGQSTAAAKDKYHRERPFVVTGDATCVPGDEAVLRNNASYPSGHGSLGYVWGALLAELLPERADALIDRGYQFGESRVVCRLHWQSDVDAGRKVGEAVVLRLHQSPEFMADLAKARTEVVAARGRATVAGRDCKAEAAAWAATARPN